MEDVRPDMAEFCAGREYGGHNIIHFDLPITRFYPDPDRCFDTMIEAVNEMKLVKTPHISLRRLCLHLGMSWDKEEAHRASYDVEMCALAKCRLEKMKSTGGSVGQQSFL